MERIIMVAPVAASKLSAEPAAREDRIMDMLRKGTIDRNLANNEKAAALLNSDTLKDFLDSFPDYQIRDGHLPPFFKSAQSPDIECLIACIICQWTRHYLKTKTNSTETIRSIGPDSATVWQEQIPELLNLIFQDDEDLEGPRIVPRERREKTQNEFLSYDVRMQQTMALMAQDVIEAFYPKFPLPGGFHTLVRELETSSSKELLPIRAILIEAAKDKLDGLDKKGEQS